MTTKFEIAVLGGDGIGPEVCDQAVRLVREIESMLNDVAFRLTEHSVGVGEYRRSGKSLPEAAFQACLDSDAVPLVLSTGS